MDARYTKLRPIANKVVKNMNRQAKENTEYLKKMTNMKNIFVDASTIPVFFLFFHVKRSDTSGEK
jgi:hypothetical protein